MAMDVLRLRLLGPPQVTLGDPPRHVELAAQKGAALLFYLAARPDQPVARTKLIALLWEESDEQEGRNSLSTALSRLRRSLPNAPVVAVGDTLVWRPDATSATWVDIAAFAELTRLNAPARDLDEAVNLWHGPFLDGFDLRGCPEWDEWLDVERTAWQQRILDALERAADAHALTRDWPTALDHSRRALAIDPFQERFHRLTMRLHEQAGDRAAALAHYRATTQMLQAELGVEPDPATQRLYQQILAASSSLDESGASRAARERPPASQPTLPLVGRQKELAHLLEATDQAEAGGRQMVVIEGEEGIGKSRLVEELVWRKDGQPARDLQPDRQWTVLVGACHASERGLPYQPFVDLLTTAVTHHGATLPISDVWLAEVARLVPDLVEQRPDLPTPSRLDPQQEARRLFEGVARFLGALPAPRLLILEDLHWADDSSLHLLDYLAHHEALRSSLVITTVRSEDVDQRLVEVIADLERQRLLQRVPLGPLPVEATVQLLREVVRDDVRQLGQQLHAETEGNPLFAVETIRSLLESGQLQLRSTGTTEPLRTPLPQSVQAVIRARVGRLDAESQDFARAAAVLGGDVDFDHVRAVAGQDEDRALAALERLLATHLLREVPGEVGEALYSFSHDKVRQVVYDDLSGARRRVQHRRALEVLSQPPARAPVERLAYHAVRAQVWDQAALYGEQAADAALAVYAYRAAADLYEQSLDAVEHLEQTPEIKIKGVLLRLRLAHVALYAAPARLGEWLEPAERDAQALGDPMLLAYVHLAQASALFIQGRMAEALPLLDHIRPTAEGSADPLLRAQFSAVLGQVLALRGEYPRAIEALNGAIALLERQPQSQIELTVATEMLGAVYAYMGQFDTALEILGAMHAQTENIQDQAALAASHGFLCSVYQMRGDWADARRFGHLAVETARAAGNVVHEYVGLVFLGLPEARLGDPDQGASTLRRAIAIAQAAGTWVLLGRAHGWLAEVELMRDQADDALALARTGLDLSQRHGYLFDAALCERAQGEALAALGQPAEAQRVLQRSLDHFSEIGALPELERTRAALHALSAPA